jgi:hypothetical protein
MRRIFSVLVAIPLLAGCVTVNRYSLFQSSETGLTVGDADVAGAVLVIAAVSGGVGGIVVWLGCRFWRRRTVVNQS